MALGLPRRQLIVLGTTRNLIVAFEELLAPSSRFRPVAAYSASASAPGRALAWFFDPLSPAWRAGHRGSGRGPGPVALDPPRVSEPGVAQANSGGRRSWLIWPPRRSSERGGWHRHALERGRVPLPSKWERRFSARSSQSPPFVRPQSSAPAFRTSRRRPAFGQDYQITFSANQGTNQRAGRGERVMRSPGLWWARGMRYRSTV